MQAFLWRLVSAQKRYATGQGNIIGQDIGASAGFGTLSFNTGWKINKYATLQGGIDNLFNKSYAEFVSKGADPSAGLQTVRVNEPGRQILVTFAKFNSRILYKLIKTDNEVIRFFI